MTKDFRSFGAFAEHLVKLAAIGPQVVHHAADQCGNLVEESARAEIGFYQPKHGPFPAWAELADSTEAEKARLGYPIEAPLLRTGVLKESISHTTVENKTVVGSTDQVMVYHEFGTEKMPPRPVLGPAMFMNRARIIKGLGWITAGWIGSQGWKGRKLKLSDRSNHD